MTQTSNIETNRLVLRPFSESDAPDVFESCKNPNLGNNAGWKPHETIEETIDVLNAIFIGKEGFMSEAVKSVLNYGFTQMGLHLITANCYPHNQRSQRVLQKNGFIYEGLLHQAELMYNGQIYDHLCYYLENPSLSRKNNIL